MAVEESIRSNADRAGRALLLTKLHPPPTRTQTVARRRLLERLEPEPGIRLVVVAAPAGSGKTTLLGTWLEAEAERRAVAWVSLDDGDNDPVVLWSHVLEALRQVCPTLDTSHRPESVGAARIVDAMLPSLVNGLAEQGDTALILDDFHRLRSGTSRDSVAWLVEHAPPSFQLVIATRNEPALPLAAMRVHGELLELRGAELGFSADEADALLNDRLDLGLARDDVDELVERTEGWPAGLYLAALSLRGVEDRHAFVTRFGGTSRHVVDFLVDEVLEGQDPALQTLMLRSSVLNRLCGPLCDALLGQDGSRERLRELARTNLFLRPLDERGRWYRFHHLFAQLLRVELERREPGLAPTLHRRAYEWHRDHGSTSEAIEHAIEAEAYAEAGELIASTWLSLISACRHATVLAWLERLPIRVLESDAALLVVRAWVLSLSARRDEALRTVALIERFDSVEEGSFSEGATSIEAIVAVLRATFHWGDIGAAYENAVLASELPQPAGLYRAAALYSRGYFEFFRGEFEEADRWLAEAAAYALSAKRWILAASALAFRSLAAGERGDLELQSRLADQAEDVARERALEEILGEAPTALGASLAGRGRLEEARPHLEQGVAVLRTYGQPIDLAHALIREARVLLALEERDTAAAVVVEARATVDSCRDPGVVEEWLTALERPRRARPGRSGNELSQRELAVLRALTGSLSEGDIARELYLSRNTVHSHTRSIYRKLGVSSRVQAVRQARELGLL